MPAEDYNKNLNYKDINNKLKNKESIFNYKPSEEVENNSLTRNSKTHPNNTLKNSLKIPKSQSNTSIDKKKLKYKDPKLPKAISKNKETNSSNKEIIMIICKKIITYSIELFQIYKTEADWLMIQKKEELLSFN